MTFLIEDTYLQLGLPEKSLLSLFSNPIIHETNTNKKLSMKLKNSFIQIMNR